MHARSKQPNTDTSIAPRNPALLSYSNSTLCPCACLLALSALRLRLLSAKALTSVPVPASVPAAPGLPTGPLMPLPPENSSPWMGIFGGRGKFISLGGGRAEPSALFERAVGGGGTLE